MSQNVTLSTMISPAQWLALQALVSGGSVTKAAEEAGVARETVSRWVHHDPVFFAELQNVRAELALQTRCALETLGIQAVGVLASAVQDQLVKPWRFKAACAVLKMIGANRAETMPSTTAEEVLVRFQERDAELLERQSKLKGSEVNHGRSLDLEVPNNSQAGIAAPVPTVTEAAQPRGSMKLTEQGAETIEQAALVAASSAAHEPVDESLDGGNGPPEKVLERFRQSVSDRVSRREGGAGRPITIAPGEVDQRSRHGAPHADHRARQRDPVRADSA
jgi:hypothetical protein